MMVVFAFWWDRPGYTFYYYIRSSIYWDSTYFSFSSATTIWGMPIDIMFNGRYPNTSKIVYSEYHLWQE